MLYKVFKIDWKNKKLISTGTILDSVYKENPWIKKDDGGEEILFDNVKKSSDKFFIESRYVSGVVGMAFDLWRLNYPKKGFEARLGWHLLNFSEYKLEDWVIKTLMIKELKRIIK